MSLLGYSVRPDRTPGAQCPHHQARHLRCPSCRQPSRPPPCHQTRRSRTCRWFRSRPCRPTCQGFRSRPCRPTSIPSWCSRKPRPRAQPPRSLPTKSCLPIWHMLTQRLALRTRIGPAALREVLDRFPHPKHVARTDLFDRRFRIAAIEQHFDQVRILRDVLQADRQRITDTVEVRTEPDMIDADQLDHVVDVGVERRAPCSTVAWRFGTDNALFSESIRRETASRS